jgi:soluble lytic murein transglycosylase-like protein
VEYYAHAYHVPVELVESVIEVESNWNPYAVSPKGAAGLMQLMPGTAFEFGVKNRFRIEENVRGGVAYLAWLIQLFRGDLRLVVGAYMAGQDRVSSQGLGYSSREVYEYVSNVARRYRRRRIETMRGGKSCPKHSVQ